VLAHLVAEGEAAPSASSAEPSRTTSAARLVASTSSATVSRSKRAISPRARRVARELGVDWHDLTGSGCNGRIRERDVRAAAGTPSKGRLIPHTTIRRTIAARMVAGVSEAAPVTLTTKLNAENLVAIHTQFHMAATTTDSFVPRYTEILVKLTAAALRQHPLLQAQWRQDGLFVPERIDIAVAVDTEAGLLAPVLRSVDRLTLRQVAARFRELVEQVRAGRLTTDDMGNATFTVSNLGNFGIDAFTPIIHLPQCAVLGIGRIVREPVVHRDRIVPGATLTLSLTFDHRIVDGAPAARFLQTLRGCLENPAPQLIA
jgi:pyruvate dehydrogenase E2 component (dihydrolipoamide acetyltransferase)